MVRRDNIPEISQTEFFEGVENTESRDFSTWSPPWKPQWIFLQEQNIEKAPRSLKYYRETLSSLPPPLTKS